MSYNYKIKIVNPDKGIVSLSPTAGTYAKASLAGVLPSLTFLGIMWAYGTVLQRREKALEINELNEQFNLEA